MIRLFVAVEIPESVKYKIMDICRGIPGIRWTPHENLHLTLQFIGEVNPEVFTDIREKLREIEAQAFALRFRGVGIFSKGSSPRVLWLGVAENPALTILQKQVEKILQSVGVRGEKRAYQPHLTLSRLKGATRANLETYLTQYAEFQSEDFFVEHITLFSSNLKSNGAIHHVEEIYPLASNGQGKASGQEEAETQEERHG